MIFDSAQILSLLKSGNPHFNKIAAKMIVDRFDIFSRLFFDVIYDDNTNQDLILLARQRFPSLNKGFEQAETFDPHCKYSLFSQYADEHKLFLEKLDEYLEGIKNDNQRALFISQLVSSFNGIVSDLSQGYSNSLLYKNTENEGGRQLMIFISGNCNLSCAYCFSKELKHKEMSKRDFETVLQWAKKNNVRKISLCGGEPLLHSQFDELLSLINRYGFSVYFASNMTVDCSKFENFHKNIIDLIFIHIADQAQENQQLKKRLSENIEYAKKKRIELVLRGNFYSEITKWKEWFHIMQEHQISTLNIALTFPAPNARNKYVSHTDFSYFAPSIIEIIKMAEEKKIFLSFAKPIPLCIFDETISSYLLAQQQFQPLCNVNEQQFTRNVSINNEMQFSPCLGVSNAILPFSTQTTWGEIECFCQKKIKPLLSRPLYGKCEKCFLYARKICQGACLSYKSAL